MDVFQLQYSHVLQGDFRLAERNLLLVFQVNCPGCFLYALPLLAELHADYEGEGVQFLGLSTAFEDFELNTLENTRALVEEGLLVGETRRALQSQNLERAPFPLNFPIAFDRLRAPADFDDRDFLKLAEVQPGFQSMPPGDRERFIERVRDHYQKQPLLAESFTKNLLPGTPSWIVFRDTGEILFRAFGHLDQPTPMLKALGLAPNTS